MVNIVNADLWIKSFLPPKRQFIPYAVGKRFWLRKTESKKKPLLVQLNTHGIEYGANRHQECGKHLNKQIQQPDIPSESYEQPNATTNVGAYACTCRAALKG